MGYKLGLDTGGTYTDAVLLDDSSQVVAHAKSPTTHHDLSIGLRGAVKRILLQAGADVSAASSSDHRPAAGLDLVKAPITLVSLSTTLATNALVEGRGRPVCLVLIGYTEKQLHRARLSEALGGDPMGFIGGGHDASGAALQELDLHALEELVTSYADSVEAFAVSSVFSVRNPEHERSARDWIRSRTSLPVSCGYELSSGLDAPRRALTAVLNARLIPLIRNLMQVTEEMLEDFEIAAPLMIVKGDGSLVTAEFAADSPVETILSGPAASVVGASFLSGEKNLVVSDMGGTTTDIALLNNGRPRLDPHGATVGGWATMVEAVRITTCGLGGDSAIVYNREARDFSVGPHRVMPLSTFVFRHPEYLSQLQDQLKLPFSTTHSAQFVFANRFPATDSDNTVGSGAAGKPVGQSRRADRGMTAQQQELMQKIAKKPISLQSLFEDQTLDRALKKLLAHGHVLLAGFTPTDACLLLNEDFHVAGAQSGPTESARLQGTPGQSIREVSIREQSIREQSIREQSIQGQAILEQATDDETVSGWNREAAAAGAKLLMRYSEQNLGSRWNDEHEFSCAITEKVSRLAALVILESVLSEQRQQRAADSSGTSRKAGLSVNRLSKDQKRLLDELFAPKGMADNDAPSQAGDVELAVRLNQPVMGIGAPAASYYPRVANLLGTRADIPELAGVANALGAVIGTVQQTCSVTITPVGGKRVIAHLSSGPREFSDLESAADTCIDQLREEVTRLAGDAGAVDVETNVIRKDVVVEDQGERVFFESRISVHASGRPATKTDRSIQ